MEGGGWYDWYVGPSWQIIRVWSVWHQQVWSHKELKDGDTAEALIVRMPQKTRQKVKSHIFMIKPAVPLMSPLHHIEHSHYHCVVPKMYFYSLLNIRRSKTNCSPIKD